MPTQNIKTLADQAYEDYVKLREYDLVRKNLSRAMRCLPAKKFRKMEIALAAYNIKVANKRTDYDLKVAKLLQGELDELIERINENYN